ncbi:uncharacterized protein LOC110296647 [Mus caroli]|uniref:Uncharacterized protein LOC110296647 n=1 Tax=Mus caroli TaxID=10089 RepID=A0A6P5PRL5_MUSCR|nr:uncharacterized protein LOC110296647 [Mus caroli]
MDAAAAAQAARGAARAEAGPVTGAGPGEAGDAPRPRLRLLPGPTAPSALGPPPPPPQATRPTAPFPAPSASRARPAAPQVYLGQAGAQPGLREPEECMAGGRRRRRRQRRRGPPGSRSPEAWRLARSPGPGGCVRPGRRGGLAGGSGGAPERPLTKARRGPPHGPPSARSRAPRAARPRPRTSPSPESGGAERCSERSGKKAGPASARGPFGPSWTPFSQKGRRAALLRLLGRPRLARFLLFIPKETRLGSGLFF